MMNADKLTKKELIERIKLLETENEALKKAFEREINDNEGKRNTHAQIENEVNFRGFFDNVPIAIFETDTNGFITLANKYAAEYFGYSQEEIEPKKLHFSELVSPEDIGKAVKNFQKIFNFKEIGSYEYKARKKNGEVVYLVVRGSLIYSGGKVSGYRGFALDLTEQKLLKRDMENLIEELRYANEKLTQEAFNQIELNEKLKQSEASLEEALEQKNKFFDIIAHDLTSPFNGFLGLLELLNTDFVNMSLHEIRNMADTLHNSAQNLFKLLRNLLEWSRSQAGRMQVLTEALSPYEAAESVLQVSSTALKHKEITAVNNISKEHLVIGDRNLLRTVIRNLILNAMKFSERGGEIRLESKEAGGCIEISVCDDGCGISEETLPFLFVIDKKTSTAGTEGEPGTGLGLILCKEFVDIMDGEISAESKKGEGSSFRFTIPKA